jgi:hypothetical protein
VLFGNADIEQAVGVGLRELVEAGAGRHRGGDRADRRVTGRLGQQGLGKTEV